MGPNPLVQHTGGLNLRCGSSYEAKMESERKAAVDAEFKSASTDGDAADIWSGDEADAEVSASWEDDAVDEVRVCHAHTRRIWIFLVGR